jgi:ATP-dependent DNA helicase RecG
MLADKVKALVGGGEGLTVEFKRISSGRLGNSAFETVAGFSNRYGGHILMGVADDGTVVGVNPGQIEPLKRNFANVLSNPELMFPTLYLEPETVDVDGKLVLAVYVPPHSLPVQFKGHAYDRAEDGDVDISRNLHLLNALFQRKSLQFTERRLCPSITVADLKLDELMPRVRQRAVNKTEGHPWGQMEDMDILRSAGLVETDPVTGKECFNLAAVLLFGTDRAILLSCPGYVIDCVLRKENLDRYDDRLMVVCNLIEAFDQIMGFIAKHTISPFFVVDGQRSDVRGHIAFEVVSNILSHQEFASSMPARITIERDRLVAENWNRPLRPGPIDPDNFKPDPKNPLISAFFVNIALADRLGSGVRNLYKYSRIYTGLDPQLIEDDVFTAIVPLPGSVISSVTETITVSVTEGEAAVLGLVAENPALTQAAMAERLEVSRNTVAVRLRSLKAKGLIRREGSDKQGTWMIIPADQHDD